MIADAYSKGGKIIRASEVLKGVDDLIVDYDKVYRLYLKEKV